MSLGLGVILVSIMKPTYVYAQSQMRINHPLLHLLILAELSACRQTQHTGLKMDFNVIVTTNQLNSIIVFHTP